MQQPVVTQRRVDTTFFPFERLPPELRNAIYEKYLVCDQPIRITHTRVPRPNTWERRRLGSKAVPKEPCEYRVRSNLNAAAEEKDKQAVLIGFNRVNILCLNKAINAEAVKMLYGANTFSFSSMPSMVQFLERASPSVKHIRHVKLLFWNKNHNQDALKLLHPATDLQDLELAIPRFGRQFNDSVQEILEHMRRGVQDYVTHGERDYEARRRRFNLITFKTTYSFSSFSWIFDENWNRIMQEDRALAAVKKSFEECFVRAKVLQAALPAA